MTPSAIFPPPLAAMLKARSERRTATSDRSAATSVDLIRTRVSGLEWLRLADHLCPAPPLFRNIAVQRSAEPKPTPDPTVYLVDDLRIDVGVRQVTRAAIEIPLPALSFDLLHTLVRAAPNVVGYDELMQRVWPGLVVNQETITQRVKLVRDALGDDPQKPRYIAGVRGRGYRMLTPPTQLSEAESRPSIPAQRASTEPHPVVLARLTPEKRSVRRLWIVGVAIALVALIGAANALMGAFARRAENGRAAAVTSVVVQPARTIAVLPFANIGGDPENEYFSDGLTEELLNRLTTLRELHVAARTSSFHFKDKKVDVKSIGQMLGVRHVLEGSVRRQGDHVRVSAQLVSTEDGYRLWSNVFDRRVADVFAIQDEIALAVVENLKLTLLAEQRAALTQQSTSDPRALDLYLRARRLYQSFDPERMEKATGYFEEAIRLDPEFVAAHVDLAATLDWRVRLFGADASLLERVPVLLHKALELDPSNADAHALLARRLQHAYDIRGAERELLRAEALNPNAEYVVDGLLGHYMTVGWPPEKALSYARKARQLDPLNPWAVIHLAQAHWHMHQYEEALAELEPVQDLDPNYWLLHAWRFLTLTALERHDEALTAAERAVELSTSGETLGALALGYANTGQIDRALEITRKIGPLERHWGLLTVLEDYQGALAALEREFDERIPWLPETLHYPILLPLHGDPRFQRLARLTGQERRVALVARIHRERAAARQGLANAGPQP
jgi:TolB-like protein/DNA-binding winged helix-turn-helix (wHTH) protein